jgi:pyrroloquinoline quinone biosynthesis protein D
MIDATLVPTYTNGLRFQWEEAQQCFVLLYPEGMVKLNPAAGEILSQVDGKRDINSIITALKEKFEGAETIEDDVLAFVEEALENNWIEL